VSNEDIDAFNVSIDEYIREHAGPLTRKFFADLLSHLKKELHIEEEECSYSLYAPYPSEKQSGESFEEDEVPPILPSFYSEDIKLVMEESEAGDLTDRFASSLLPSPHASVGQCRIDSDVELMKEWLDPLCYPLGKWPSRHQPSLMQQLAINISLSMLDKNSTLDIFSVNGPPGTGKTTLLKELIAGLVVKRAQMLIGLNPGTCGIVQEVADPPEKWLRTYYRFPQELDHFSLIVASNNNAAVENISLELPLSSGVVANKTMTGLFDVDNGEIYFTETASACLGAKAKGKSESSAAPAARSDDDSLAAWGLIALRLGNRKNIGAVKGPLDKLIQTTGLLGNQSESLDWDTATAAFKEQLYKVTSIQDKLVAVAASVEKMDCAAEHSLEESLLNTIEQFEARVLAADNDVSEWNSKKRDVQIEYGLAKKAVDEALEAKRSIHFFSRRAKKQATNARLAASECQLENIINKLQVIDGYCNSAVAYRNQLREDIANAQEQLRQLNRHKQIADTFADKHGQPANNSFFEDIVHNRESQAACPWATEEFDAERERLFYHALQVHKAFAQNSKLKQNIRMLSACWNGEFSAKDRKAIMSVVFPSLFLLAPVVSSTFASIRTLLKDIEKNQLGLLVVDEAGQATPQSALGALWRCQKAVIVGDPLQVEPVNPQIKALSSLLRKQFGIPEGSVMDGESVQGCADSINKYVGKIGDREVGCPLVVHRRCIDPMFSISNRISYDNRMVQKTGEPDYDRRFLIEESSWFDIAGKEIGAKNHFVKDQGDAVIKMLREALDLYGDDVFDPDKKLLFIISPFVSVKEGIIKRIKASFSGTKTDSERKSFEAAIPKIVGTIHTFQGREADEVILVLGCDKESGSGAAAWAGSKPNILNVAVTRARYRLGIMGDRSLWSKVASFDTAAEMLPVTNRYSEANSVLSVS
jgi:hypothetical protein